MKNLTRIKDSMKAERLPALFPLKAKTPLGDFHMIIERWTDTKGAPVDVVRASGFGSLSSLRKRLPPELISISLSGKPSGSPAGLHPYQKAIVSYFKGDARAFDSVRFAQSGNDFSEKVWKAIASIPYGETVSYQKLALMAGNPKAVRAAGTACGANRLILFVPCHRVLRSDGGVGEYLYGKKRKKSLLEHEVSNAHRT